MSELISTEKLQELQTPVWRGFFELGSTTLFDPLNGFLSLLGQVQTLLDIIATGLDAVKAFIPGLLDPLSFVIDSLLEELKDLIDGILNIGVHLTYDDLSDVSQLKGGYQAFERRLFRKLLNKQDPSSPKPSASSLMLVGYASTSLFRVTRGDGESVTVGNAIQISQKAFQKWIALAKAAKTALKRDKEGSSDVDTTLARIARVFVEFAPVDVDTSNVRNFKSLVDLQGTALGAAQIAWSVDSQSIFLPRNSPNAFIVEVSSQPSPSLIVRTSFSRNPSSPLEDVVVLQDPYAKGQSLQVLGGVGLIDFIRVQANKPLSYSFAPLSAEGTSQSVTFIEGGSNVDDPTKKAFLVKAQPSDVLQVNYRFVLTPEMLPNNSDGSRAEVVYVRVLPVKFSKDAIDGVLSMSTKIYEINQVGDLGRSKSVDAVGTPSPILTVRFPKPDPVLDSSIPNIIQTAYAVVLLSKASDDPKALQYTNLPSGLGKYYDAAKVALPDQMNAFEEFVQKKDFEVDDFRNLVNEISKKMSAKYLGGDIAESKALQNIILNRGIYLLNWKFSDTEVVTEDYKILESITDATIIKDGPFANKDSISFGDENSIKDWQIRTAVPPNLPVFVGTKSPKLKRNKNRTPTIMLACRDLFTADVYAATAAVLNVTSIGATKKESKIQKDWYALTLPSLLSDNSGFKQFEQDIDTLVTVTLANLKRFTSSMTSRIEEAITLLQARILEIQNILDAIESIISIFTTALSFKLSLPFLLTITDSGVEGLVRAVATASNKPLDTNLDYGFGAAVVIPIPLTPLLRELIFALFPPPSEEGA